VFVHLGFSDGVPGRFIEVNNILAAILGYTEMAAEDIPDQAPARHDLEQVLKATHRAKDLVRQILPSAARRTPRNGGLSRSPPSSKRR
jgi:hypothetical protein